jgi:xanthine dehydrogenase accessory factor
VGKAVVWLAKWLGFYVVVNDDRPEFCNPEAVPGGDAYLMCKMEELPQRLELNHWTYLVLTTRGMNVDVVGLPALLDSPVPYLGVIGSQRRWALTRKDLLEKGTPVEQLDRVRAPIGLELNAETPEEIALSIMAEVVMLRQGGDGAAMSQRKNAAAQA